MPSQGQEGKGGSAPPPTRVELAALAQAKLAYVRDVLQAARNHGARVMAIMVDKDAPTQNSLVLSKDFSYLLQRFYLQLVSEESNGIVVFDELDKSQCHVGITRMYSYFKRTSAGKRRAKAILPEPFYVHSELTTLIQLADLVAYIVSWGVRPAMATRPRREELTFFARQVESMKWEGPDRNGRFQHAFHVMNDMRPKGERR